MKITITMRWEERFFGILYLLNQMFVLPFLLQLINQLFAFPFSQTQLNALYFFINFAAVTLIFRNFLWKSLKNAQKNLWKCLRFAFWGFVIYQLLTHLVDFAILRLSPDFSNANDSAIADMVTENAHLLAFCTIFLVPVTEECLYRGLFFLGLAPRGRFLAYGVSALLFSAVHVVGYIGQISFPVFLLSLLQYLPAGLCLGWAYEKSDSIVTPILIHMAINQIGISSMR